MSRAMVIPWCRGRMGNFLFQTATAMAYAWDHELDFTVPTTTNDRKWNPIYLQHLANPNYDPNRPLKEIIEKRHTYQSLPFRPEWRGANIQLRGWWQTEKYFKAYRKQIITAFGYPWKPWKGMVSVHVRRGDYLTLKEKHPVVTTEWYLAAMKLFPKAHFTFYSDEPLWCKQTFGGTPNVHISMGQSEEQDLISMSECEHHICSASTFSWWGAWLNQNPNKRVIMPKNWFQPGRPEDTSDIVPAEWERM